MADRRHWLVLLLLALCCLRVQAAVDVVDDRGAHVQVARPPLRIVSLSPTLTETVCALGACDRLVGVDDWSDWPASVHRLPRVGGLEDARIESIVALQPDLPTHVLLTWVVAADEIGDAEVQLILPEAVKSDSTLFRGESYWSDTSSTVVISGEAEDLGAGRGDGSL